MVYSLCSTYTIIFQFLHFFQFFFVFCLLIFSYFSIFIMFYFLFFEFVHLNFFLFLFFYYFLKNFSLFDFLIIFMSTFFNFQCFELNTFVRGDWLRELKTHHTKFYAPSPRESWAIGPERRLIFEKKKQVFCHLHLLKMV